VKGLPLCHPLGMRGAGTIDVNEIDAFLASDKRLMDLGQPIVPDWKLGPNASHYQASWVVEDAAGIARGSLKFRFEVTYRENPSIMLVCRSATIWRVDLAEAGMIEDNPHDAWKFGLPARVFGPHEHRWPDNRGHVEGNGYSDIPYRRPLNPQIRRFEQALLYLGKEAKIHISPPQRGFDLPPQGQLELRERK
jgi:hypothetical protein